MLLWKCATLERVALVARVRGGGYRGSPYLDGLLGQYKRKQGKISYHPPFSLLVVFALFVFILACIIVYCCSSKDCTFVLLFCYNILMEH